MMGLVELNGILFDRTENVLELLSEAGRPLIQSGKWQGLFPKAGGNPPVVDGVESQRRFVAGALATLFLSEAKCFQRVLDCPVGHFHAKRERVFDLHTGKIWLGFVAWQTVPCGWPTHETHFQVATSIDQRAETADQGPSEIYVAKTA